MRVVRVLLVEGFNAFFRRGGGEIEADSVCAALNAAGVFCQVYGPNADALDTFDVVIHFSSHPSGREVLKLCRQIGIRFVFWPNLWLEGPPLAEQLADIEEFHRSADRVVFKSNAELQNFVKLTRIESRKFMRVNWFIDPEFCGDADPARFKAVYGLDDFVLSVGLIEPVKNQLSLVRACVAEALRLVMIGGFRDRAYFDECVAAGQGKVLFIPQLPRGSHMLRSAYAACRAYAEFSRDPPGRSALEAALQARPLALTDLDWTQEIFDGHVAVASCEDSGAIGAAVRRAWNEPGARKALASLVKASHLPKTALQPLVKYLAALPGEFS